MKCTIVDVAKQANVSVATVSRVINGNYPVSTKTKLHVQKVIEELHFIPNMQAREIKKRTSNTIGVVVPSVDNMFFPEVIHGIEQYLMQESYSLMLSFSKNSKEQEQECVLNLLSRNVAGIIVADAHPKNVEEGFYEQYSEHTPITFINGNTSLQDVSYVICDEQAGAKLALETLWEHGHRDIYFVRGEHSYSYDVKEEIYHQFLKEHQAICHIVNVGEGNGHQVMDVSKQIMLDKLKHHTCSAAFCCNDLMAIGVLHACKEQGINVSEDFSIIGFDNTLLATLVEPKLTTVDQNMYQLGYQAAMVTMEHIQSKEGIHKKVVLPATLVNRDTLGYKKGS